MTCQMKIVLFCVAFAGLLALTTGSPFRRNSGRRHLPGKPDDMTIEEFLETRGQGRAKHANIRRLANNIKRRFLKPNHTLPDNTEDKFDDLVFTEEQLLVLDQALSGRHDDVRRPNRRHKRKIANFANPGAPFRKWTTKVVNYLFDGTHTVSQQVDIRAAMDHWAEKTCLSFVEAPSNVADVPYIYLTKNESDGCWSYVGRVTDAGPQILNLASDCFLSDGRIGTIVHELGHALGFVHEHTRDDRDVYVTINEANILTGLEAQFALWQTGWLNPDILAKTAYDTSSIMHYSPKAFSSNNDYTITANNPLYAGNMGQRRYLTFWDAYAANQEYCSDVCSSQITCQRGGYQNPNNCTSCVCPDGFTGQYCEKDKINTPVCPNSGRLDLGADPVCIDVRLDSMSNKSLECDWHIQAASGCTIDLWFDSLNLACSAGDKSCYDYVEVKYADDLAIRGPRFCCTSVPDAINGTLGKHVTSANNELVINLASYYSLQGYMPSFRLCLKVSNSQCVTTTATTPTTTTKPTTTTTTSTTTTTTATSTTTTLKPTTTSTTATTTTPTPTTTTTTSTTSATTTTTTPKPTTTTTTSTTEATKTTSLSTDKTSARPTRRPTSQKPLSTKPSWPGFWWSDRRGHLDDSSSSDSVRRPGRGRPFSRQDSSDDSSDDSGRSRTRRVGPRRWF